MRTWISYPSIGLKRKVCYHTHYDYKSEQVYDTNIGWGSPPKFYNVKTFNYTETPEGEEE